MKLLNDAKQVGYYLRISHKHGMKCFTLYILKGEVVLGVCVCVVHGQFQSYAGVYVN